MIYVLIACEESQVECLAFRNVGCEAYSCDIQQCSGGNPQWHIVGDVTPYLNGLTTFRTQDGSCHHVPRWDLIIAHPPCTYICKVSAVAYSRDPSRHAKMLDAVSFFHTCLAAFARYVAVENPLPMARAQLPKPSTYVQPFWFGSIYSKKTLLWLKNLPPLMPTSEKVPVKQWVHCTRGGKKRSKSFIGIAEAMAKQWVPFIQDDMKSERYH